MADGARISESDTRVLYLLLTTRSESGVLAFLNLKQHIHQMGITSLTPGVAGTMHLSSLYKLLSTYYVTRFA